MGDCRPGALTATVGWPTLRPMKTLHSKKILHLGKYYHPHRGGMETVLRQQAEGLVERGCRVTVLVAGSDTDCGHYSFPTGDTDSGGIAPP